MLNAKEKRERGGGETQRKEDKLKKLGKKSATGGEAFHGPKGGD